jgi:hypothetical protein
MSGEPPYFANVRRAVLSGRPIVGIDLAEGDLMAAFVEAVRVSGRRDDLRLVYPGGLSGLGRIRFGARRIPPDLGGLDSFGRLALADVPLLDPDELGDPRLILLMEQQEDRSHDYVDGFLAAWISGAGKRGAPGPAVFTTTPDLVLGRDCFVALCGGEVGRVNALWICGGPDAVAAAVARSPADAETWRAAVARCDARCTVRHEGTAAIATGDGRAVMVRETGATGTPLGGGFVGVASIEVVETGEDGWPTGSEDATGSEEASPERLAAAARIAWRGGIEILRPSGGTTLALFRGRTGTLDLDPLIRGTCEEPLTDGALATLCRDLPLIRALSHDRARLHSQVVLRWVDSDPGLRVRRRDFVLTWPALTILVDDAEVRRAVDDGVEMLPVVGARVGGKGIARRLVGVPRLHSAFDHGDPLDAAFLAAVGHDRLPAAGDLGEWEGFVACADAMALAAACGGVSHVDASDAARLLLRIPGRGWSERYAAIHRPDAPVAEGVDFTVPNFAWESVGDFVTAFSTWVGALCPGVVRSTGFKLLCGYRSFPEIVAASDRWHELPHLHNAMGLHPDTRWPVPFDVLELEGGWSLRALSTMRDLVDEGRRDADASGMAGLSHCVASYGPDCLEGNSLILSLRREVEGIERRVGTIELTPFPDGAWTFGGVPHAIVQHRGHANAAPTRGAQAMVERALTLAVMLAPDGILPAPDRTDEVEARFLAADLVDEWRQVMPPDLAALPPEEMVARIRAVDAAMPVDPDHEA